MVPMGSVDDSAIDDNESILDDIDREELRDSILNMLQNQGFSIENGKLVCDLNSKTQIRKIHEDSVRYLRDKNRAFIDKYQDRFIDRFIADGKDIDPENIRPVLVEINGEKDAKVFRWVKLHWSIPTSAGYGRRLRYLVMDDNTDKLIGIIGMGDPVFGLKDRDTLIGWTFEQRKQNLKHVMDAFVLGAVPPYNMILGGKLVASLVASKEISDRFKEKYGGKKTIIGHNEFDGTLAAVTTASALGKSSIYDRLKMYNPQIQGEGPEFLKVGWTSGSGEFPFINSVYDDMRKLMKQNEYTGKREEWGNGIRSRRYVINKTLTELNLPRKLMYHGVKRELFIVNLGHNWKEYLCNQEDFSPFNESCEDISDMMVNRWVAPRAERNPSYKLFQKDEYRLI